MCIYMLLETKQPLKQLCVKHRRQKNIIKQETSQICIVISKQSGSNLVCSSPTKLRSLQAHCAAFISFGGLFAFTWGKSQARTDEALVCGLWWVTGFWRESRKAERWEIILLISFTILLLYVLFFFLENFIIELFPFLRNHSFRVTAFIPLMKVMQG